MGELNYATLFVARLTKKVCAENLAEVFGTFGHVFNARIIPQNKNQLSNYGFVEMDVAGAAKALQSVITMDNVRLLVRISDGEPSERSKRIEMRKQRQKFYESKRQMTRKINRLRYTRSDQYKKTDNSDDNEGSSSPSEDKE